MKLWIGKTVCAMPRWMGGGHKRGRDITDPVFQTDDRVRIYECPRCLTTWKRLLTRKKPGTRGAV